MWQISLPTAGIRSSGSKIFSDISGEPRVKSPQWYEWGSRIGKRRCCETDKRWELFMW